MVRPRGAHQSWATGKITLINGSPTFGVARTRHVRQTRQNRGTSGQLSHFTQHDPIYPRFLKYRHPFHYNKVRGLQGPISSPFLSGFERLKARWNRRDL